ncbi:MAG: VCBS repeat-containing protein [Proteobacteria bacterium]|nr:VCBS repeat-containing protein [Pseudomonadota bacterium]
MSATRALWVDYEHDGDLDLVLGRSDGTTLWQNNGDGTFEPVGAEVGFAIDGPASDLVAVDLDGNIAVDLIVASASQRTIVFENQRAGVFKRMAEPPGPWPPARRVLVEDLNNDGTPDAIFVREKEAEIRLSGMATSISLAWTHLRATGAVLLDFDNDGFVDLLVFGLSETESEAASILLYRNLANTWQDVTQAVGLSGIQLLPISDALTADLDRDGDTDLLLVTTAIKPTSRIFERYGGTRLPQPGFDRVLYWVIDGGGFVRAGLRKKGLGPVYSWIVGTGGGILLNARMRLSGRRPFAPLDDITIITVDQIDEAFDALWQRKTGEYPGRLLARRDAESLRWHFEAGAAADQTRIICCRRDGQLEGYAVLIRDDAPGIGLKRFKIADLFAAGDEEKTVGALLTAAYEYSLAKRCHVLEIIGLPKRPRSLVLAHKPFHREMPTFPFYFKALREDLKKPLETEDGWYVTAFDGDTALL